jgi:hypothetical protein
MQIARRAILALALIAGLAPAMAQVPPPVPALPDAERRTTYSISASTCACSVGFQLYGDSTDVQNWLEVWVNGVLQSSANWTITSPTGPISTIPRPITDAVLTFTAAQTGTVQIVGARRPRRTTQFQEGQPVPTRNFNQAFSDIIATQRELWDKTNDVTGRSVIGLPGETLSVLPSASTRANNFLFFDSQGNPGISSGSAPTSPVTNANLAPMPANTLKCNSTTGSATPTDCRMPWVDPIGYGALCDGATDDTTAFNNAAGALGPRGGIVSLPAKTCCLKSGITITTPIRIVGAGTFASILSACGADTTVVTLNSAHATIEHVFLIGKGAATDTFGATQPTLKMGSSCTECLFDDLNVIFGYNAINIQGSDSTFNKVTATQAYGPALVENQGGGSFFIRNKYDQSWPTNTIPVIGSSVPAWIANHAYALNTVVSSGGYILQNTTAGTSGSSSPTLRNYNLAITDNTAQWMLVSATSYQGMEISGASSQNTLTMCDFTGSFTNGISVFAAVTNLLIDQSYFGQQLASGIATTGAGQGLVISGSNILGGILTTSSAIGIGAAWVSDVSIVGNHLTGGFFNNNFGISVSGGVRTTISANTIQNFTSYGIVMAANVTDFAINGNVMGGNTNAVGTNGTSDYYNITNNVVHGGAINDSGSGSHKTVSGNN